MEVIKKDSYRIPVFSWCPEIEEGAMAQIDNLAQLPFAKHIAVMPDCHQGYGMPIGGVLSTKGVVIPNAVGVDIGCGMISMKTNARGWGMMDLQYIVDLIKEQIPVGFNWNSLPQNIPALEARGYTPIVSANFEAAKLQVGTLGGGNHFIEIQEDGADNMWVMIHSGSRNLGKKVAEHYNKVAQELNELYYSSVSKDKELAFLPVNTPEFTRYMAEMKYCVQFAKLNRDMMMLKVKSIIEKILPETTFCDPINIAHNYAQWEHWGKDDVIVHRKGATHVPKGAYGVIPGSMGTHSYIVKGLRCEKSLDSCSHGAGRAMGRKAAQRNLNLEETIRDMGEIIHDIKTSEDLEEAPGAYKSIEDVMANQADLVEIITELTPVAVVKG